MKKVRLTQRAVFLNISVDATLAMSFVRNDFFEVFQFTLYCNSLCLSLREDDYYDDLQPD
jgi:hypothetical protein